MERQRCESRSLFRRDLSCAKERIEAVAGGAGSIRRVAGNRGQFTAVRMANEAMRVSRDNQTATRRRRYGRMGLQKSPGYSSP